LNPERIKFRFPNSGLEKIQIPLQYKGIASKSTYNIGIIDKISITEANSVLSEANNRYKLLNVAPDIQFSIYVKEKNQYVHR